MINLFLDKSLGLVASEQGNYSEAQAYFEKGLTLLRKAGSQAGEGVVLSNLGTVFFQVGQYTDANSYHFQALALVRKTGYRVGESEVLAYLGLIAHNLGHDETALLYGYEALQIAEVVGARREKSNALTSLGHSLFALGRLDEAGDAYRSAFSLRQELGEPNRAMEPLAGQAWILLARGETHQAKIYVDEILQHLKTGSLDGSDDSFLVYLTCFRVLRANGDSRAEEILDTVYALLQEHANKINDPDMRQSFSENIPSHRELIAEWEHEHFGKES